MKNNGHTGYYEHHRNESIWKYNKQDHLENAVLLASLINGIWITVMNSLKQFGKM